MLSKIHSNKGGVKMGHEAVGDTGGGVGVALEPSLKYRRIQRARRQSEHGRRSPLVRRVHLAYFVKRANLFSLQDFSHLDLLKFILMEAL